MRLEISFTAETSQWRKGIEMWRNADLSVFSGFMVNLQSARKTRNASFMNISLRDSR